MTATSGAASGIGATPLDADELRLIDAWWRAANYVSVGQIYLLDNPLLREPLRPEHVKPRLLGHWGTTPGLNLIYAHMNRVIRARDLDAIYVIGPGHGGPAIVANAWLEGTYSEMYPSISRDAEGMRRLFRQFSFPGGIPSHVAPETPGSIHEGGELGYALVARVWRRLRQPRPARLLRRRRRRGGDRTAGDELAFEQVPRPGARRRRAADPAPQRLQDREPHGARPDPRRRARRAAGGLRLPRARRRGRAIRPTVHQQLAATLDAVVAEIAAIQRAARVDGVTERPRWPMIVLRTPKGWTGPAVVDGLQVEGTWRAHQVPMGEVRTNADHRALLETWMRSYRPEELFDEDGSLRAELAALAPTGTRRMSANPVANGGELLRDLDLPDFRDYAVDVPAPGATIAEATRVLGTWLRDVMARNRRDVPRLRAGRDRVQPARRGVRGRRTARGWPRRSPATITSPRTAA